MHNLAIYEPVDYLVIGHLTQDLTERGPQLGGTAAYASLTARAIGLRVGIVTSMSPDTNVDLLAGIQICNQPSEYTSTFKNIYTNEGRIQYIYHTAGRLGVNHVPEVWRNAPIVHLGPVMQEVEPALARAFPTALIGITPQGYLREADADGRIHRCEWPEYRYVLEQAGAAVLSVEDVSGDESRIDEMASAARILVATEGAAGSRLFWNGDVRRFRAPLEVEVDPVGAGDIFAAAFFVRLYSTRDPWEAARFATLLASNSVTRSGLAGVPTPEEVQASLVQVV